MGSTTQEMTTRVPQFTTRRAANGSVYRIDESQELAVCATPKIPQALAHETVTDVCKFPAAPRVGRCAALPITCGSRAPSLNAA